MLASNSWKSKRKQAMAFTCLYIYYYALGPKGVVIDHHDWHSIMCVYSAFALECVQPLTDTLY